MENIPPVARNDNRSALPGVVANRARRICGDRVVFGAAWFRGHDWPWHFVNSANLARCVCGTGDTLWLYLILQAILSLALVVTSPDA